MSFDICFVGAKPVKQPNNSSQTSISFIHEQELQMKIAENESLHKQLQEANSEHEDRTQQLTLKLEQLQLNKGNYEKMIADCNSKNNVVIEKLKEEQQVFSMVYLPQIFLSNWLFIFLCNVLLGEFHLVGISAPLL